MVEETKEKVETPEEKSARLGAEYQKMAAEPDGDGITFVAGTA